MRTFSRAAILVPAAVFRPVLICGVPAGRTDRMASRPPRPAATANARAFLR